VKHRGGKVLHDGGTDDATGYLYADSPEGTEFHKVPRESHESLQIAEDVCTELASQPDDEEAFAKLASEKPKDLSTDASPNEVMNALALGIWSGTRIGTDSNDGNVLRIKDMKLLSRVQHRQSEAV
jgi:hypothetical protein